MWGRGGLCPLDGLWGPYTIGLDDRPLLHPEEMHGRGGRRTPGRAFHAYLASGASRREARDAPDASIALRSNVRAGQFFLFIWVPIINVDSTEFTKSRLGLISLPCIW